MRIKLPFSLVFVFVLFFCDVFAQPSVQVVRCTTITRCTDGGSRVRCRLNSDDPCACPNEGNVIVEMDSEEVVLLADTLCITAHEDDPPLDEGEFVFIDLDNLPINFLDSNGENLVCVAIEMFNDTVSMGRPCFCPPTPMYCDEPDPSVPCTMSVLGCGGIADYIEIGPANAQGEIKIPFWREFGQTLEIDLNPDAMPAPEDGDHHFEFPCNVTSCPPLFVKTFEPPVITDSEPGYVVFTINRNEWPSNITQIAFEEILPEGLMIHPDEEYEQTCEGGTLDLDILTGMISYTGGMLPLGVEECSVSVKISGSAGEYTNQPILLTTIVGDDTSEPATVRVLSTIPTLSEWALIILSLLLIIAGTISLHWAGRRIRKDQQPG